MSPAAVPRSLAGTTIVQLAPALWDELALLQSGTRVVIAAKAAASRRTARLCRRKAWADYPAPQSA